MAVPVIDLSGTTELVVDQVGRATNRVPRATAPDHVNAKAAMTH